MLEKSRVLNGNEHVFWDIMLPMRIMILVCCCWMQPLPSFLPSPLYPFGHVHITDPILLLHFEFVTHGLVALSPHSSISAHSHKATQIKPCHKLLDHQYHWIINYCYKMVIHCLEIMINLSLTKVWFISVSMRAHRFFMQRNIMYNKGSQPIILWYQPLHPDWM